MQKEENFVSSSKKIVDLEPKGNLPALKPEDLQYFDELLADVDEESLPAEKQRERKIMRLLLKFFPNLCLIMNLHILRSWGRSV